MDPIRVLIVGHSFIANLKNYIRRNLSSEINYALGLHPKDVMIQYSDRRGGSLSTFRQHQLESVHDFEPHIVVLQLGSNDLCNRQTTVENFTNDYHSVIKDLLNIYKVQRVVVLQILHRLEPARPVRYYVDPNWFNPRVDEANITLRQLFKDNDRAILWNHKGFWDRDYLASALQDDGVHIADVAQWKYIRNIRAAVVSAIKHLKHT
ncbi:MAG: SGNH/GDSL hydrolase family protein [Candidatus Thiodiazotropha sp.]